MRMALASSGVVDIDIDIHPAHLGVCGLLGGIFLFESPRTLKSLLIVSQPPPLPPPQNGKLPGDGSRASPRSAEQYSVR